MTFFERIFGSKKKDPKEAGVIGIIDDLLSGILSAGRFELEYEVHGEPADGEITIEFFGADEELLVSKEGQLLDAFQLYIKRVLQHQLPEEKVNLNVDCAGFRQQANDALIELADKLKDIALTKGKSVFFRALPPKDRKVIHQYLAEDGRVKSRSVGDGHFKKIKIFPVKVNEDQPV